jgi:hypothetical protein
MRVVQSFELECNDVNKCHSGQLAFLRAVFLTIFGVLPRPRLRVSAPRNTTFSIVVVCI